jgi:hypothetical protein
MLPAHSYRSHGSRTSRLLLLSGPLFGSLRDILATCKTLFGMRRRYELSIPTGEGEGLLEVAFA